MDAMIKAKWIEALRSGEFKQGRERLRDDKEGDHYCCLGVLCCVAGARWEDFAGSDEEGGWITASDVPVLDGKMIGSEDQELTPDGLARFGIPPQTQGTLIEMNDGRQMAEPKMPARSFAEIADYIEKNL